MKKLIEALQDQATRTKDYKKITNDVLAIANRPDVAEVLNEKTPQYFDCPASSNTNYHGCFKHGLVIHSLQVMKYMATIARAIGLKEVTEEDIVVSALLHDWGKIGDQNGPNYIPETSQWHREKLGRMYKISDKIMGMETHVRSLWLINYFGLELTQPQWHAVAFHGQKWDWPGPHSFDYAPLTQLISQGDIWAAQKDKI